MADVIIVGAGPAGSALALGLARTGCSVVLLDGARFPREKLCGDFLNPRAVALLEELSVAGAVRARARLVERMRVVCGSGVGFTAWYPKGAAGLAIPRSELDAVLVAQAAAARGVEFLEGVRAEDLLFEDGRVCGVYVRLRAGGRTALRAPITVGADGRHSVVAHRLGLIHKDRRHRKMALGARYELAPVEAGTAEVFLAPRAYAIVNYLADGTANLSLVADQQEIAVARGEWHGAWRRLLARFPDLDRRLDGALPAGPMRVLGPMAQRAARAHFPGGLLVGDAAGFYDPFTGEGVCAALECARMAAPVIVGALASGGLERLSEYERVRRRALAGRFRLQRALQAVIQSQRAARACVGALARMPAAAAGLLAWIGDARRAVRAPARESGCCGT
ncbi:MAG: NAD(P)/FAD-dependent oxidoreductase [Bryobacterales bacterium]|nr:NAD(P)/FAD-dependent oxidoreductase [Bryobacteraceae bacterium]MDW8354363.1 NAD(P)/FAD-dependent oxidoreductase [Bryobacterales bacterium]